MLVIQLYGTGWKKSLDWSHSLLPSRLGLSRYEARIPRLLLPRRRSLTDRGLLGLLGAVFTPASLPARHAAQVQRPPNQMIPHTRTILTAAASDQHDGMLLDVVPLAGDVRRDRPSGRQPDSGRLALARVGLLGARDADLEADALALRGEDLREGRGDGVAGSLGFAAAAEDLVECCALGRGRREGALCWEGLP